MFHITSRAYELCFACRTLWSLLWTRISANCETVASQQPVWAVQTLTTRISCLDVFTIFCYNTVIPLNKLTCLGQQNINLRIRDESFLVGKKHTTLYKYVIIFGAACIFLRRPIFIFKDLTNVIFGIGSTKTSESTFRTLRVCCAAWLFLAPLFHKKRKWIR